MNNVRDITGAPQVDAIARLLLLLSQVKLAPQRIPAVRETVAQVGDWDALVEIACRKFVAPYCHQHLLAHASDLVPARALERLGVLARTSIMSVLRLQAALTKFHRDCVVATGARYAKDQGHAQLQ